MALPPRRRVSVEQFCPALYQVVLGAATKMQQELASQASLVQYQPTVEAATLGLLASALWMVEHVCKKGLSNYIYLRCQPVLREQFFQHIIESTSEADPTAIKKELQSYLEQLYTLYDRAWQQKQEPGSAWWVAEAMARELLDTKEVPQLAIVILVGEVEATLLVGARLVKNCSIY